MTVQGMVAVGVMRTSEGGGKMTMTPDDSERDEESCDHGCGFRVIVVCLE
jgi:hypothetical protein